MKDDELLAILALLKTEGVGDIFAKKLISHFGSAEAIFKSGRNNIVAIDGVGERIYANLQNSINFKKAAQELDFIKKENIEVLYYQDSKYPERLKHCIDGPVLLFSTGNIDLNKQKIISIVGTRNMTNYGGDFCKNLLKDLVPFNPIIVSGFAYGVDIFAHTQAMDLGLQTIGVLAHGMNQIYPKNHKRYVQKMEQNGGFLTEFWSDSNPDRENFIRRNRIVAGISEATIVIESAEKGGSIITANLANDYNRDVFAVPGRVTDTFSQGANLLIKTQRANLLQSAKDLVYILNWETKQPGKMKTVQKQLFVEMNPDEQLIYDYLFKTGKELLDIVALECEMPVYKISSLLIQMELKGLIRPLPGKYFEAI
uniref:DNA-processing protein DprA n=1 Tax=Flavobacterium sp. TaxID=239 RepID=UPI004049DF3D